MTKDIICKIIKIIGGNTFLTATESDELNSTLFKQIPMKLEYSDDVEFCPKCHGAVWQNLDESNYCFTCGKSLK